MLELSSCFKTWVEGQSFHVHVMASNLKMTMSTVIGAQQGVVLISNWLRNNNKKGHRSSLNLKVDGN